MTALLFIAILRLDDATGVPRRGSCYRLDVCGQKERHGQEVRKESAEEGRAGDARAEAREAALGPVGQEGEKPEAGDRHRPLGGSESGSEGAQEEGRVEEVSVTQSPGFPSGIRFA